MKSAFYMMPWLITKKKQIIGGAHQENEGRCN
jgi:hypothetical protein